METKTQNPNNQYLAALVVSIFGVVYGAMVGWASPSILLLTSDDSPLQTGKLSVDESSTLASMTTLGFVLTSSIFGLIANKFGRKWPLWFLSIPTAISWMMIWFAPNIYYLCAARLFQGAISAGMFSLSQFYFVEISNDTIRGALGSVIFVSGHIGVPIVMALGAFVSYESISIFGLVASLLFGVLFFFFPETPLFLIKRNKISEAEKSIRFYRNIRGNNVDCALIQSEIDKLKCIVGDMETRNSKENSMKWSDIITNPGRKSMIIGIFLATLNHFSGSFALISYTATIFENTGSFMSSNDSALVIGIIQFIGTVSVPFLVERTGRKNLYIMSTIGSMLGYLVSGFYIMFKSWGYSTDGITWIPIVSLSFVILAQSLAISTLSLAVTVEILPEKIKEFGVSFCNTVLGICATIVLKFMPLVSEALGFHATMFLFGGICVPTLIFILFYLPETKGKSYEEIMKMLQ